MSCIDAKPCLIIQFAHCMAHISHQSGAGSHGNIAAWQVTPVLFPGALDPVDIVSLQCGGAAGGNVQHPLTVINAINRSEFVSQRQRYGAWSAAHIE